MSWVDAIREMGREDQRDYDYLYWKKYKDSECFDCGEKFDFHLDRNFCPACGSINIRLPLKYQEN